MKIVLVGLLLIIGISLSGQEMQTFKVRDNLYMVGDRTFSLFYITDSSVVVIDPISAQHATATMKAIREVTSYPVSHVFYSHNHWDHISGAELFLDEGAVIISHELAKENITPNDQVVIPTLTWEGEATEYQIGGKDLQLYYYGPNHGDGMTVFRFPEHNIVFTIDLVVPDRVLYAYLPDANPKNWVRSLEHINQLEFDTLLMAHLRPVGSRDDLINLQNYFNDLYAAVQLELDSGTNLFEIPNKVKLPTYRHWKMYDQWLSMNVWRILMEKSIGQ